MAVTINSIVTPQSVQAANAFVTTANTTFTSSPTNTVLLITAGANGARVTRIDVVPQETVTASALQLYRSRDAGTTKCLFRMRTGASDTVSGTDGSTEVDFGYSEDNPLILMADERVYVATGITKNFCFNAEWANY
jgi:hypothetical protein